MAWSWSKNIISSNSFYYPVKEYKEKGRFVPNVVLTSSTADMNWTGLLLWHIAVIGT